MRTVVLLDLDGTLTKSDEGILSSVRGTFEIMGYPVPNEEELQRFIGPAIVESMARNGIPESRLDEAVQVYRQQYIQPTFPDPHDPDKLIPGMYLNEFYAGIPEALQTLRESGYELVVSTCKPEPQAKSIAEYFGLTQYVDGIYGASVDNSRLHKDEVIRHAFQGLNFDEEHDVAVMVGDRWTDVDGAHAVGLECIGCRWGYAEPNELEEHGAVTIADTVEQLPQYVDNFFANYHRRS